MVAIVLFPAGYWFALHSTLRSARISPLVPPATQPPANALNGPPSAPVAGASGLSNSRPASRMKPTVQPQKRPWDTNFLAKLGPAFEDTPIQFELLNGEKAAGTIQRRQSSGAELVYVSGQLTVPSPGRFFFQKQTLPGVAGPFVGVVEFASLGKAYRIEPAGTGSGSELVERRIQDVLCTELPQPEQRAGPKIAEIPPLNPGEFPVSPPPGYQNGIVSLQSLIGAKPVIYLDFQGGYTEAWGGIAYQRSGFNNGEIFEIWRRVSEDYMPFNINVTTDLKVFQKAPQNSRQRVIVTPTDTADPGAGGASLVGSFNWGGDTPCWVFVTDTAHDAAEACSHEAGHTLGLIHDGQEINGIHWEYYYGHDTGNTNTGWAPIMGYPYDEKVTQWSKGEYFDANNQEDQIRIIANQNNVQFRPDDTGDTLATSRYLEVYDDGSAGAEGVIEITGDTDAFQFTTGGGEVFLQANPAAVGANLAIQASLYDAADTLLTSANPQDTLWASIATNLPAGTYTFRVTGAGRNDPVLTGFSPYASLGYYSITGQVANARLPDRFAIGEYAPTGTVVGVVAPKPPNPDPLVYTIASGNTGNTFAIDNSGTLTVANNSLLNYETLARNTQFPVQFQLLVNIIDGIQPAFTETNRRVLVAITNINEPPVISGFVASNFPPAFLGGPGLVNSFGPGILIPGSGYFESSFGEIPQFSASVLEHSPPGSGVGTLIATDPDLFTLLSYSIIQGNEDGMFGIDSDTGTITVAGDPTAAIRSQYNLTIVVSDQTPPVPLVATSMVSISVELPYQRGSIACAVYTNIPGVTVPDLTSAASFPSDPSFEEGLSSMEAIMPADTAGFGMVMRGYLLPPATGLYTFWLASQDDGELWLSTSTNPATLRHLAWITDDAGQAAPDFWTNYPSRQSVPISLAAGVAYYIEARAKAGAHSSYLGVAWDSADNGIARQIVPGQYLSPFHMNYVPHPIGFSANLARNAIAGSQVGTVRVSDVNEGDLQELKIVAADAPGAFALDSQTGAVRLMDESILTNASISQYHVTVQATDNGAPPLSGTTTVAISLVQPNLTLARSISAEIWTNLPGNAVSNLTSQAAFPKRPSLLVNLDSLELSSGFPLTVLTNNSPVDFTNGFFGFNASLLSSGGLVETDSAPSALVTSPVWTQYGCRIRGYLTPTNTGSFTFFISSADDSVFLLSPTSNPGEVRPVVMITGGKTDPLQWTQYPSQQSTPIWLYGGTNYYFETLSKTGPGPPGTGGPGQIQFPYGHVEVGWAGPGLPGTNVIDGAFLSPANLEYPPDFADQTVVLPITTANGTVITTLAAEASPAETLAYKILSGNVSNTFTLNPYTGELSVADNSTFANYAVSNFTLLVEVQDSGYAGLFPLSSALARITLPVVDNSAAFVWSGGAETGDWSQAGNWNGSLPNDRSKLTFQGTREQTNHNDILTGAGLVTLAIGGFYIDGAPLVLRGGLLSRGSNTWAITSSSLSGPQTFTAQSGALDLEGGIRTEGNLLTLQVDSMMFLDGAVSGTGGLLENGRGPLVVSSSNTYSGPTDISGVVLLTNAGSIASSPSLNIRPGAVLDVSRTAGLYSVVSGQTLTGNGTVIGPIRIAGSLAPTWPSQASGQTMVFSNRLVLAGNTTLIISPTAPNNQTIKVAGQLDCGGTLTVLTNQNLSWLLQPSFRLFSASQISGSFKSLNLPPGFQWDTTQLYTNGTIRLLGPAPVEMPILPLVYSNGTVVIQFASVRGIQYTLESTLSLRPPVRWSQSAFRTGTGGIISIPFSAPPTVPQRFFRVIGK